MGYKLKTTKNDLYNKGFHYNKNMSDETSDFYSMRFSVSKYNKITTLECELAVDLQSGDVIINVFNYGTNDIYIPYYNREFGKYKIIDTINKTIEAQLKKLGAKETK